MDASYYLTNIYQNRGSALDFVNDVSIHNNNTALALNNRNLIIKKSSNYFIRITGGRGKAEIQRSVSFDSISVLQISESNQIGAYKHHKIQLHLVT